MLLRPSEKNNDSVELQKVDLVIMANAGGNRSVIVRGFDFGTTHEQIASHMSSAGNIESIDPVLHASGKIDLGVVRITYATAEEAKYAVQLQQTCIAGNSRYIDVITLDPTEFLAQQNIEQEKVQQFFTLTPEQQQAVMARGTLSTARDPNAVLVQRMNQARGGTQSFNSAAGGNAFGLNLAEGDSSNLGGRCCVLVRGFDFNTSEQEIVGHMSRAGTVQNVQKVDSGSISITFASAEEAKMAVQLNQTIIAGNSRYIDVMLLDPEEFLSQQGIDMHKAMQFKALTPDQQLAVMAKGSLSTARDPNAVLVSRMNQVKQKGSFGPAQGMKGNAGSGPYGGGTGKGPDMQTMMMQMMGMMMKQMQSMNGSAGASTESMGGSFGGQQH